MPILEDHLEQQVLDLFKELGYAYECGYDIAPAPDGARPERENYRQVWLMARLEKQLACLNPHLHPTRWPMPWPNCALWRAVC